MSAWWLLPCTAAAGYIAAKVEETLRHRRAEEERTEAFRLEQQRLLRQYAAADAREKEQRRG